MNILNWFDSSAKEDKKRMERLDTVAKAANKRFNIIRVTDEDGSSYDTITYDGVTVTVADDSENITDRLDALREKFIEDAMLYNWIV